MMTKVTLEDVKKIADSIGDMMIMTKIMMVIMTIPGGRTLMKGGTLGNMERRRGERSSNAILTFASFSPALNVTCYFFSFRSRLVICDPLTSIDSLHLNSQVKKNNVVFKATD